MSAPGGSATLSPAQLQTLRAHGEFTEPRPWETLVREWHVEGLAVRPAHSMNGHTGFLVTSRRMSPGERAPVPKRRPAPGAYGPEYDGPRRDATDGAGGASEQLLPNRDETRATSPVDLRPDE